MLAERILLFPPKIQTEGPKKLNNHDTLMEYSYEIVCLTAADTSKKHQNMLSLPCKFLLKWCDELLSVIQSVNSMCWLCELSGVDGATTWAKLGLRKNLFPKEL